MVESTLHLSQCSHKTHLSDVSKGVFRDIMDILFILQMIMTKIKGAQCPMMTKKYTKFEKDSLKDSREKLLTNPDRQTDGQTG